MAASSTDAVRRVYIDGGTNWGDTLDLYRKLAAPEHRNATNWEIYSFEPVPGMASFLHRLALWKNGLGERPVSCMPMDGGSSFARNQYAPIVGCARPWIPKMNFCMRKIFARVTSCGVTCFPVDHALLNAAHVARQLGVAATPHSPSSSRPRYTFVPAAVGARNFTTDFGNVIPGAYANPHARSAKVEVVNFPSWFARHFRAEDYVLVKLDIEGFEHTVLRQLLAQSSGPLIDHLAWECHPVGSAKCTNLSRALTAHGVPWMADRTYEGLLSSKDEWHARVAGLRADLLSPACARFNVTVYEPSGKLGQKCHVAGEPRCHEGLWAA